MKSAQLQLLMLVDEKTNLVTHATFISCDTNWPLCNRIQLYRLLTDMFPSYLLWYIIFWQLHLYWFHSSFLHMLLMHGLFPMAWLFLGSHLLVLDCLTSPPSSLALSPTEWEIQLCAPHFLMLGKTSTCTPSPPLQSELVVLLLLYLQHICYPFLGFSIGIFWFLQCIEHSSDPPPLWQKYLNFHHLHSHGLKLNMNLHMDEAFIPPPFHLSTPLDNMNSQLISSLLPFPPRNLGCLLFPSGSLWDQLTPSHFPPGNLWDLC